MMDHELDHLRATVVCTPAQYRLITGSIHEHGAVRITLRGQREALPIFKVQAPVFVLLFVVIVFTLFLPGPLWLSTAMQLFFLFIGLLPLGLTFLTRYDIRVTLLEARCRWRFLCIPLAWGKISKPFAFVGYAEVAYRSHLTEFVRPKMGWVVCIASGGDNDYGLFCLTCVQSENEANAIVGRLAMAGVEVRQINQRNALRIVC